MANINIQIPDELHRKVKINSAVKDKTIQTYVIEALEEKVKREK